MDTIGLWHINDGGPARLSVTELAAERDLEAWIERDPALLESGLVIVGRQVRLEGGPLDLLALDPQGRWVLIEIKRERLRREVIAQAIDYASCLQGVAPAWLREQCDAYLRSKHAPVMLDGLLEQRGRTLEEEADGREILTYLVGTGLDSGLERMVGFLAERAEMAVRLVTFSVFRDGQGKLLLAREIHESDEQTPGMRRQPSAPAPAPEAVLALADQNGVGGVMRTIYRAATELGLHVRSWGRSIMFAPPTAKKRCLFTVWTDRRPQEPGVAKSVISPEAFEQFYGIKQPELRAALQVEPLEEGAWVMLNQAAADRVAAGLKQLRDAGRIA